MLMLIFQFQLAVAMKFFVCGRIFFVVVGGWFTFYEHLLFSRTNTFWYRVCVCVMIWFLNAVKAHVVWLSERRTHTHTRIRSFTHSIEIHQPKQKQSPSVCVCSIRLGWAIKSLNTNLNVIKDVLKATRARATTTKEKKYFQRQQITKRILITYTTLIHHPYVCPVNICIRDGWI